MSNKFKTTKLWEGTIDKLRLLSKLQREPASRLVDKLINAEIHKIKEGKLCTENEDNIKRVLIDSIEQ